MAKNPKGCRWNYTSVSNTLPFWQTLDTHRGPVHLSRRWHSSCRGRRTASSSERSWPAPAPCVGNDNRAMNTSISLRADLLSFLVRALWVTEVVVVGGGVWADDGKCFRFKQVESATAALCSLIPTQLHTRYLVSCRASHFSLLDTRLTVWFSCTFFWGQRGRGLWAITPWDTFLYNLKKTLLSMFNVWCQ